jgi:pimeloyl-ACP methyl ester carboxylesterase
MDIKMNYVEKGEGKPLLLLHGNGENLEFFEGQIDELAKKHRVIAVDSRAHGKTPRGTAPLTIRQMAEDVRQLLKELGIARTDLVGWSDGGNIGLILAMESPELLDHLVTCGANLTLDGAAPEAVEYVLGEYKEAQEKGETLQAEILGLMVNDPNIDPEDLTRIPVPTLIMAGTEDLILPEHTKLIASKIPGAKVTFLEGDHYVPKANPAAFNAAVEAFLAE